MRLVLYSFQRMGSKIFGGDVVKGFVKGFKSLIYQAHATQQQQQTLAKPPQNNNNQLGPFNGAYPTTPPPIQSTSPGSSVPQVSDMNLDPTQLTTPNAVWTGMSLPSRSAGSLSYTSEGSNLDAVPGRTSYLDRDPGENGDTRDGGDGLVARDVDIQSVKGSIYPPSISTSESIGTCKLKGCSNLTFVDSVTDLESEYCSWKHQE